MLSEIMKQTGPTRAAQYLTSPVSLSFSDYQPVQASILYLVSLCSSTCLWGPVFSGDSSESVWVLGHHFSLKFTRFPSLKIWFQCDSKSSLCPHCLFKFKLDWIPQVMGKEQEGSLSFSFLFYAGIYLFVLNFFLFQKIYAGIY